MIKSLIDMYSAELEKQPEANPVLSEIIFLAAFPKETPKTKAKELSRLSEDLFEEFNEAWTERVKAGFKKLLDEDMQPQMIVKAVPFITREELKTVMAKIDEFLPGDTEEILALRMTEIQNQYNNFMITATEILKQMYSNKMVTKQQSQIITSPGLTDSLGYPIGNSDLVPGR